MPRIITTRFTKNREHIITSACEHQADLMGIPQDSLVAEQGYTAFDLPWAQLNPELAELKHEEDCLVFATNKVSRAKAIVPVTTGSLEWALISTTKTPTESGLVCEAHIVPLNLVYFGWPERLDFQQQVLRLPSGQVISRRDLRILRSIFLQKPRKVIARDEGISVKMVEKIQQRLKDRLCLSNKETLIECALRHQILPFIFAQEDWFELTPKYIF